MIRLKGNANGRQFLLLGLDRENINRLTSGQPIRVLADSVELEQDVLIVFGETLQDVADELVAAGIDLSIPAKAEQQ